MSVRFLRRFPGHNWHAASERCTLKPGQAQGAGIGFWRLLPQLWGKKTGALTGISDSGSTTLRETRPRTADGPSVAEAGPEPQN